MKRRRLISSLSEAGSVFFSFFFSPFVFFSSESAGALLSGFDVCCLAVADAVQDFTPSCDHETMHMLTDTGSISDNSLQRCIFFFFFLLQLGECQQNMAKKEPHPAQAERRLVHSHSYF